jgi:sugar phosphate isomerase/epimerase
VKYAICNELFEGQPLEQYLPFVAGLGYTGLEVAPFAFDKHLAEMTTEEARALGERIRSYGLAVVGTHWLLARTQGLHINSPDRDARDRAVAHMTRLARRTGDLGAGIMVFGSPVQRAILPSISEEEAFDYAVTFFRRVAPVAQEEGVVIAVEPLAHSDTNFMYTKDQAVSLIEAVGHPSVGLHLDVRAMSDEGRPLPAVIHEAQPYLRHFHANDGDIGPGMGPIDFHPILGALKDVGYGGWVSVEVFDFSPGAERIARESIAYLKQVEQEL